MRLSRGIILFIGAMYFFTGVSSVSAQDTFGPICDGVTVTCPPSPVPTDAQPTTPPEAPPVAGHTETLLFIAGLSGLCIAAGILLQRHAAVEA